MELDVVFCFDCLFLSLSFSFSSAQWTGSGRSSNGSKRGRRSSCEKQSQPAVPKSLKSSADVSQSISKPLRKARMLCSHRKRGEVSLRSSQKDLSQLAANKSKPLNDI